MSLWTRLFGQKTSVVPTPSGSTDRSPLTSSETSAAAATRRIRVFISSTFRDMIDERDVLMTHTWPELRRLCQDRHVELVEVDLRWGIAESQSTRRETLKLCLDEIRTCRPFFIGLLGERYGWTPGDDAFTADLQEEQPWLVGLRGKSVTELEILHGVLNNPDMADRAFFYFRDPAYAQGRGPDFLSESDTAAEKQSALKASIRTTCMAKPIPLRENYPHPSGLAALVLADLSAAIEAQFSKDSTPDPLTREAQDHEAFAEIRRRTYVERVDYFEALDSHAACDGSPLLLLGDSGGGKSALLANWLAHWRKDHPTDFIVQHYIGGTADSADHWRLMTRLMAEIKRWSGDPEALPTNHDDVLKDFPLWLIKARSKAMHEGVRFILVLDALNQLDDHDHARLLGWLPEHPFTGPLRLIASTLPGKSGTDDPQEAIQQRRWQELRVQPLTMVERQRMIEGYLARFGKTLDEHGLVRLASAAPAANPLYLKVLLDDLRVTGTFDRLDQRLSEYLAAPDIATLLQQVLARYQRDYERDRPGLVAESLGLIYAARRGLSETELLYLLRPADQAQLPPALWTPLRAALEDALVDRGGILNFSHDFLRTAVGQTLAADENRRHALRMQLVDYFEAQPITARTCDELPWLLKETASHPRLRACLLDIDRFLRINERDEDELRRYWVEPLHEQQTMGILYIDSFERWSRAPGRKEARMAFAANVLGLFLHASALHAEAESLLRRAVDSGERTFGQNDPTVATRLNNLAQVLEATNRFAEAEPLMRRALDSQERSFGNNHHKVAVNLSNLAALLHTTNRPAEAEPLMRRALEIDERSFGKDHAVARGLNNLAALLSATNRLDEAEPLLRRALHIAEHSFGKDDPAVAIGLNNLAQLLSATNRLPEAEPLMRRALEIDERNFGKDHPIVGTRLNNLAGLLKTTNRLAESEPLIRRALEIDELTLGLDHSDVARDLNNLAQILQATSRVDEAEPLMRRALSIDERRFGRDHPSVAMRLSNLAMLLQATSRLREAEPLMRRALDIDEQSLGKDHPNVARDLNNLAELLQADKRIPEAEPLLRRALGIYEDSVRNDHPDLAVVQSNLAGLLFATSRFDEAEPLMRRALDTAEHSFGKDDPTVAERLNNLAQLLQDTNRLPEAEPLLRRALEIEERTFGKDHPYLGARLNNLAALLAATNRLPESEALLRRALDSAERVFGTDHQMVAIYLNRLAHLLQATNRFAEAEPLMRRALDIAEHSFGPTHPTVAGHLRNVAALLKATNRLAEAEPLMRRVLDIAEHSLGTDHPDFAEDINNLVGLLWAANRLPEAEPLMRRALDIAERSFGKDHPTVARNINNLAALLKGSNQFAEAELLMRRALDIAQHNFGADDPKTATGLNNLAQLLHAANRLPEAEPLMRRALEIDELSFGKDHPDIAIDLNNLAQLLKSTNRFAEAEPLMRRMVEILLKFTRSAGRPHPHSQVLMNNYAALLRAMGRSQEEIAATLRRMADLS